MAAARGGKTRVAGLGPLSEVGARGTALPRAVSRYQGLATAGVETGASSDVRSDVGCSAGPEALPRAAGGPTVRAARSDASGAELVLGTMTATALPSPGSAEGAVGLAAAPVARARARGGITVLVPAAVGARGALALPRGSDAPGMGSAARGTATATDG